MTIKRVAIEKKQEFILYDKDDRKLITIDALSENYDKFQKTLSVLNHLEQIYGATDPQSIFDVR